MRLHSATPPRHATVNRTRRLYRRPSDERIHHHHLEPWSAYRPPVSKPCGRAAGSLTHLHCDGRHRRYRGRQVMSAQHTPGPWKHGQYGDDYMMKGASNERVFSIRKGVIPMNADAHLIAAAPALLQVAEGA